MIMNKKRLAEIRRWVGAGCAVAMMVGLHGCSQTSSGKQGVFRIIGVDTSGSAQADLGKYQRIAYRLVRDLQPGADAVRVCRFDHDPHEILSSLGQRREVLLGTLVSQLKIPAEHKGTRMAKFYERVAELLDSPETQRRQIEIYVLTDNGNDDSSPAMVKLSDQAALKIAGDQRVTKIGYWGVRSRLREGIPAAIARLPDSVLTVQGATEEFASR